jgi:hypothetical protein
VRSFQFGVRCFDPCADLVPVLPFGGLLKDIHVIAQPNLGSDLQTKIPDGSAGLTAFRAMVGSPYGTVIEHRARPTYVTSKDRMERTAGRVVAAEHPMVDWLVAAGILGHKTV